MLDNIFKPLFEVTVDPSVDVHLYQFLGTIGGFDTVDDESTFETFSIEELKTIPSQYTKGNSS